MSTELTWCISTTTCFGGCASSLLSWLSTYIRTSANTRSWANAGYSTSTLPSHVYDPRWVFYSLAISIVKAKRLKLIPKMNVTLVMGGTAGTKYVNLYTCRSSCTGSDLLADNIIINIPIIQIRKNTEDAEIKYQILGDWRGAGEKGTEGCLPPDW